MSQQGRVRGSSVVFPLLVIAFGILMLLWRWLPDFNPWPVLGKYWPLFLILVGAGMFWDRSQRQREPDSAPAFPIGSTIATFVFLLCWRSCFGAATPSSATAGPLPPTTPDIAATRPRWSI